jgi:hypothetical protein
VLITESSEIYDRLVVILLGIMLLGLKRIKDENRLMNLLGFSLTLFSLWLFPYMLFLAKEILIGGWIYIYANSLILLTFSIEFFSHVCYSFHPKSK